MSEPVVFFHNPLSRGRIAHWMLEESGAPYEVKLVDLKAGAHKRPDFLAVNPMGKIPAIVHRGVVITETAAICAYLADAFPQARLAPAVTEPQRGTYFRWLFFSASCLEHAFVDRVLARPAPDNRSTLGYGSYEDTLNALEQALTPGPYVLGETFSAADVHICSALGWAAINKALESRPVFDAYMARCMERPAYKRMMEQCSALIEELKKSR